MTKRIKRQVTANGTKIWVQLRWTEDQRWECGPCDLESTPYNGIGYGESIAAAIKSYVAHCHQLRQMVDNELVD